MPGFTHLQTAQPVTLGHHLLAWNEMLERDYERLQDCRRRLNRCPLGAAALAGTTFPIDRAYTAEQIGRAQSELQSRGHLVCRLLLEKKKQKDTRQQRRRTSSVGRGTTDH